MYADFCAEFLVDPDTLADNDNDDPLGASAGDDSSKYSEYIRCRTLNSMILCNIWSGTSKTRSSY